MVAQSKQCLAAEKFISDPQGMLKMLAKLNNALKANKDVIPDWTSNIPQKTEVPLVSVGPGGIGNYTQKELTLDTPNPLNLRQWVRAVLGRAIRT